MSDNKKPHLFERVIGLLTSTSCSCAEQAQAPEYAAERNILKMHGFNVVDMFPPAANVKQSRNITVEELRELSKREGWPRQEYDGNFYDKDQYDIKDADEHGELPPIYTLKNGAVPVVVAAAPQNADQNQAQPLPIPAGRTEGGIDVDTLRQAAERTLDPTMPSVEELKAAADSVMPEHMHGGDTDPSEEELEAYDNTRKQATAVFYELMRGAGLMPTSALAGNGTPPQNNAGLYQGRIAEIDPVRWNTVQVNPLLDQYKDHNMTNLTYPSLSDEEDVIDVETEEGENADAELAALDAEHELEQAVEFPAQVEGEEEEEEIGIVDGGNISLGDPAAPTRIIIAIQEPSDGSGPERIRFFDQDGEMVVEAADFVGKSAAAAPSAWWRSLTPERRRAYLESHPNSKYAKAFNAKKARKAKKAAKKIAKSKKGSAAATKTDKAAADNAQAIKESGVTLTDTIPEELDNEQDKHLDKIENEMLEAAKEEPEVEEKHPDDVSESEPEHLPVEPEAVKDLVDHSKRDGFFKPVVSAVKKRVSNGSLGAMGRMMKGTMREGDKEKAIKGLTVAIAAITVVGVGAGLAALGGPGLMMKYVHGFANAYEQFAGGKGGDSDGFNFSSESASADEQFDSENDDKTRDQKDMISDEGIADMSSMFLRWLEHKSKTTEDSDEEE